MSSSLGPTAIEAVTSYVSLPAGQFNLLEKSALDLLEDHYGMADSDI